MSFGSERSTSSTQKIDIWGLRILGYFMSRYLSGVCHGAEATLPPFPLPVQCQWHTSSASLEAAA
ncbi:hypothetical protein FIBSPDRAFT_859965 [Athelia psychrophila]|uniref:Uncharacterized protein n=1 Tax=Athelia psychrophila TaxID=1759441 RepID=A0A166KNE8_9AGAM|nr:hypothetical protein FIBSPDRAFT_859965 [Fibularhizoctonia sp. CBS 109695]